MRTMTEFEREAAAGGFLRIAGVDEAGRGPLAGPLVAAAVILHGPVEGLNDSKQLTEPVREALFSRLFDEGHAIGISVIDATEIDAIGLQNANYKAMADAAGALDPAADFLLVDGFAIKGCPTPLKPIVKGDARSVSIAAASIVAKVTRDRILVELDAAHPEYGFAKHKGYGTKAHLDALNTYGPCPAHRRCFAPVERRMQQGMLFE